MERLIFVVDDDADDIGLLTEAISEVSNSSTCVSFLRPDDMLSLLVRSEEKPSLIFIDINMGAINGKECLQRIKSDAHISSIPVIMCSTSNNVKDIRECLRAGAAYYLQKPSHWDDWKFEVRKILNDFFRAFEETKPHTI